MTTQRFGSLGGQRAIGAAQRLMKFDRLRLEAVGRALAAPALGARQADRRRHVEDEGEIGHGGADRHAFEAADQLGVDLAERALIDAGGIDEAVADHPFAVHQRRPDRRAHVIVARGREQDRLGLGAERLGDAGEQDVADDLGAGRAARLAREHDLDAERSSRSASAAAWVDLPLPSPPSKVMKRPRINPVSAASMRPKTTPLRAWPEQGRGMTETYSRSAPARNSAITISVTASKARWEILPLPTLSAALSGICKTSLSSRQTLSRPIGWPCVTGAGTGP